MVGRARLCLRPTRYSVPLANRHDGQALRYSAFGRRAFRTIRNAIATLESNPVGQALCISPWAGALFAAPKTCRNCDKSGRTRSPVSTCLSYSSSPSCPNNPGASRFAMQGIFGRMSTMVAKIKNWIHTNEFSHLIQLILYIHVKKP